MKILRQADAWGVARAKANASRNKPQNSEAEKQRRRDLNRRLAEKLVGGWSAYEYRQKFDDEIAKALDGEHDGVFDVNADKYSRTVAVQPRSFGADANAAAAATDQRTKQRLHNFHSIRWNGEKA